MDQKGGRRWAIHEAWKQAGWKRLLAELGTTYPNTFVANSSAVRHYSLKSIPKEISAVANGTTHGRVSGTVNNAAMINLVLELVAFGDGSAA